MRVWRLVSVALLTFPAAVSGQQQARPSCSDPAFRQFDFWVGDWEVTDSAGKAVYGTNRVTLEEGKCLVHEHWTGSRGGTGQSFNFRDPQTGHWTQLWVGNDGLVLDITGGLEGKAMVLTGEGVTTAGQKVLHRASWTPMPDGRVRQFWQQSSDAGTSWTVVFVGWYRKKG